MTAAYLIATVLSVCSFLWYGLACLFSNGMTEEFARFGLSRFRRLTGALEVAGAAGIVLGQRVPLLLLASAAGLALLMLLGLITRRKVGDPWYEAMPAAVLMLVNAYIAVVAVGRAGLLS